MSMVAAGIGLAIVASVSTLAASGVQFLPLEGEVGQPMQKLPLAVAWMKVVRDPSRDAMLNLLRCNPAKYAALV